MRRNRYPRERIEPRLRSIETGAAYRLMWRRFLRAPLACKPNASRFCDGKGYGLIYAAFHLQTAVLETLVSDRFVHTLWRVVRVSEIRGRGWGCLCYAACRTA